MDDKQRWQRLLGRASDVLAQLHVTKCRQDRMSRRGGGVPSNPLVFRVDASEAQARIREVLQGIAVAWAKDHKATAVYVKSPQDLVVFIRRRLEWVTKHQLSPFWEESLSSNVRRAWHVVDVPVELRRLGVCGAEVEGGICRTELWHEENQSVVECPVCGAEWSVLDRNQAHIDEAADETLPLKQAVWALVEYGMVLTLRQAQGWTERVNPSTGQPWLSHTAVDENGVRLYRMGDVAAIAEDPPRRGRPRARAS